MRWYLKCLFASFDVGTETFGFSINFSGCPKVLGYFVHVLFPQGLVEVSLPKKVQKILFIYLVFEFLRLAELKYLNILGSYFYQCSIILTDFLDIFL